MDIVKRSGATEAYDGSKIVAAIAGRVFRRQPRSIRGNACRFVASAEESIAATDARTVEAIQDIVERSLMEQGYFDEAKAYILYRHRRTELRTVRADIVATAVASCDILSCGREPSDASFLDAVSRAFRKISRTSRMPFRRFPPNSRALSKPTCPLTSALNP